MVDVVKTRLQHNLAGGQRSTAENQHGQQSNHQKDTHKWEGGGGGGGGRRACDVNRQRAMTNLGFLLTTVHLSSPKDYL